MAVAVTLYETEIGVLLSLPEEQRGRILTAILCDTTGQELPQMDASDNAIFTLVNAQVKRAPNCQANESKAQSRGGKARQPTTTATSRQSMAAQFQCKTIMPMCKPMQTVCKTIQATVLAMICIMQVHAL